MKDTEYALVVSGNGGDIYNNVNARTSSLGGYSDGQCGISTTAGSSWEMLPDSDIAFKVGQSWHQQSLSFNARTRLLGLSQVCQTFTPGTSHYLSYVSIPLSRVLSKINFVTVSIYNVDDNHKPTGSPLCYATRSASGMSSGSSWQTFGFVPGCHLSAGTEYALVVSATDGVEVCYNTVGSYDAGQRGISIDGGATWQMMTDQDLAFKETQGPWCEYYSSNTPALDVYGQYYAYQTFTPTMTHYLEYVSLLVHKIGSPNYTISVALYNTDTNHRPTGSPLCSTTYLTSWLARTSLNKPKWTTFVFPSGCEVLAGTEYAIVVSGDGGSSVSKIMLAANPTGGYAGGQSGCSSDSGTSWARLPCADAAFMEGQLTWREQNPSYSSRGSQLPISGNARVSQTFIPLTSHYFNYVSIPLYKTGAPYNMTVTLALYHVDAYHQPTGQVLCSTTLSASSLRPTSTSWVQCRLTSGYYLTAGTEYALVISADSGDFWNYAVTRMNTSGKYSRGCILTSSNSGASWTIFPSRDLAFYEGGPRFW
jgi:hypothetical protein